MVFHAVKRHLWKQPCRSYPLFGVESRIKYFEVERQSQLKEQYQDTECLGLNSVLVRILIQSCQLKDTSRKVTSDHFKIPMQFHPLVIWE